jgi:uncharacterized protein involved in outer membrane biogenesis
LDLIDIRAKLSSELVGLRSIKFFRNLRTAWYLLVFGLIIAAVATLLYLNATGMPLAWRTALEKELSKQGVEASISRLRYIPMRGIEASEVEIFTDSSRQKRMVHLERLVFDLDKTKAMRGIIRLTHVELNRAELSLPVDPEKPFGETLDITELNGKVLMGKNRKFEIKGASGIIGGIHLKVDATILGFRPVPNYDREDEKSGTHRRLMKTFVEELARWQLDHDAPPELQIKLSADATKWSDLECDYVFSCPSASRDDLTLSDVRAEGNVYQSLLTVQSFSAKDERGSLEATFDYDLDQRAGHYDATSSLDLIRMIYAVTQKRILTDFSFAKAPHIQLHGTYAFPEDAPMQLSALGQLDCKNVLFRGSPLTSIKSEFSYRDQNFFLRNLEIEHTQGKLLGQVLWKDARLTIKAEGAVPFAVVRPMIREHQLAPAVEALETSGLKSLTAKVALALTKTEKFHLDQLDISNIAVDHQLGQLKGGVQLKDSLVLYQLESTLPPTIWKPFFVDQPLEKVLGDFQGSAASSHFVKLTGKSDLNDKYNWAVQGQGKVENIRYRDVPVFSVSTQLDLKHNHLNFSQINIDFDYRNYELHETYKSSERGPVQCKSVTYNHKTGMVGIHDLRGYIYPVPLLRMFAIPVAKAVEEYRFQQPPPLAAEGAIDVRNRGLTRLNVEIQGAKALDWKFLGKPVTFSDVQTKLLITGETVTLNRLSANAFGGTCAGTVVAHIKGSKKFDADVRWNGLRMQKLGETYAFKEKGYGTLTGRINLSGVASDTRTLNGEGLCSLEKGELFAVPMFGPLSPIISAVLGDRRAGFERAKDAFCNFTINKGVIHTNDFATQTSNMKFTGNGDVDLNKDTIDMTMRMNARGLLGIITLPLQPIIKGLFQFHGQGPMKEPKWEHVIFTSPPEEEKESLLRSTPLRAIEIEE